MSEVLEEIMRGLEDLDKFSMLKIWDYFLSKNIVMKVDARFWKLNKLPKEPWVNDRNVFQIPTYY